MRVRGLAPIFMVTTLLSNCTTPTTILKNPKNGQIVRCGGSTAVSLMGGAIGYHIDKSNSASCVADYMAQGFERIEQKPGTIGDY